MSKLLRMSLENDEDIPSETTLDITNETQILDQVEDDGESIIAALESLELAFANESIGTYKLKNAEALKISIEEMSGGLIALVVAGIAALIALIVKVYQWLFGKDNSSNQTTIKINDADKSELDTVIKDIEAIDKKHPIESKLIKDFDTRMKETVSRFNKWEKLIYFYDELFARTPELKTFINHFSELMKKLDTSFDNIKTINQKYRSGQNVKNLINSDKIDSVDFGCIKNITIINNLADEVAENDIKNPSDYYNADYQRVYTSLYEVCAVGRKTVKSCESKIADLEKFSTTYQEKVDNDRNNITHHERNVLHIINGYKEIMHGVMNLQTLFNEIYKGWLTASLKILVTKRSCYKQDNKPTEDIDADIAYTKSIIKDLFHRP